MLETSSEDGLTVSYDDETGIFTFDWNEETHPEYNFIKDFTEEDFAIMMREYLETKQTSDEPSSPSSC